MVKRKYLPAVAFCSWGEPFKPVSGAHHVGRGLGSSIEALCVLSTVPHCQGGSEQAFHSSRKETFKNARLQGNNKFRYLIPTHSNVAL